MPDGYTPNDDSLPEDSLEPIDLNHEPPVAPDDTNPSLSIKPESVQPIDLHDEPPISPDDTNPSKSQLMRAVKIDEPPLGPDDTSPSLITPPGELDHVDDVSMWRRAAGVLSLLLAFMLTGAAVLVFMAPVPEPVVPTPDEMPQDIPTEIAASPEVEPSETAETVVIESVNVESAAGPQPTISVDQVLSLLQQPITSQSRDEALQVVRNPYAPFTLIPDRPRGEVIPYVVEQGDTINGIAEKFGIAPESVVWANNRDIVGILPPGQAINIVPEDGVLYTHVGSATIAEIAAQYGVDDPYQLIDSEYNPELRGLAPDDVPPSGARIMIVGGVAEQINWNPTVVREGGGASGDAGGNFITFAPGDPGSCGRVENPGGGAFWTNPLGNYTWMRGFTSFHTGVDLAAGVGTPVAAANSGRVIFSGWNNWGYGYTVVLAHGPFTTLYGHLSSIYVSCGQDISAGSTIAAVGNTGNSSGPHLHFEIRFNDQPQDPTYTIGF